MKIKCEKCGDGGVLPQAFGTDDCELVFCDCPEGQKQEDEYYTVHNQKLYPQEIIANQMAVIWDSLKF